MYKKTEYYSDDHKTYIEQRDHDTGETKFYGKGEMDVQADGETKCLSFMFRIPADCAKQAFDNYSAALRASAQLRYEAWSDAQAKASG